MIDVNPLKSNFTKYSFLASSILLISCLLVGIWAVDNTIALRNVLLVLGAMLSIFYWVNYLKCRAIRNRLTIQNLLPLCLVILMIFWVIFHYLFLSRYPTQQLNELTSVWTRTAMGVLLGSATGLILRNKLLEINLLWVATVISFLFLIFQYIPVAIQMETLLVPHFWDGFYIYSGKINGVLAGSILLAGITGVLIDLWRSHIVGFKILFATICFWMLSTFLTLYAYVFIFDTKNGLGLAVLLFLFWAFVASAYSVNQAAKGRSFKSLFPILAGIFLMFLVLVGFGSQQFKRNAGWGNFLEDVSISVQTNRYKNWQNIPELGYPQTNSGRAVAPNTYERAAWFSLGVDLVPENPWGIGVLGNAFPKLLIDRYPKLTAPQSHSGWLELTLSFGIPGLILTLGALLTSIYSCVFSKVRQLHLATVASLGGMLIILYLVGELNSKHAIEILYYWIALITTLQWQSIEDKAN